MSARSTGVRSSRTAKGSKNSGSSSASSLLTGLGDYFRESERPLVILAFLLPFVVLYELGSRFYHENVTAFSLLEQFAGLFNVYGRGVPAALLVLTLLASHVLKRDRWTVRLGTLGGMLIESLMLALPLFVIALLFARYQAYVPMAAGNRSSLGASWVLSLGAGVYEELLFRFFGCGGLRLLAEKGLGIRRPLSTFSIVLLSSVLFSLYHYLGTEHFSVYTFVFRVIAGAYFAGVFLNRNLGVSAGSHAIYDVIVVTFRHA